MAEDAETPEEVEEYELTDAENEQALMFPVDALGGQIKGFMDEKDGIGVEAEPLTWEDLKEPKNICYLFNAFEGVGYYLSAQVVDGFVKIRTALVPK